MRSWWPGALALAIVAGHFASFDVADRPIVTDVRYFLYYAWQVSEGAVPHLDFFENKPQLSVLIGAGWMRLGELLGADPLVCVRVGQLVLAGVGAWLAFVAFRRLGGIAVGFIGLAGTLAFGLLGALPAVGPLPKLAMAVLATTTALLAADRRYLCAGITGGLAFFDWQVGAAAWLAACVAAFAHAPARWSAVGRVAVGGALPALGFGAWYAARGALAAAVDQVIVATFFRGTTALGARDTGERLGRLLELVRDACPEHAWLLLPAVLGVGVAVGFWSPAGRGARDPDRVRLMLPLCVFHGALLVISALEVQGYGDLFALLHTAAFALGLAGWALLGAVRRVAGAEQSWAPVALVALVLLAARPGPLRPVLELATPEVAPGATLSDQREVARAAASRIGDASFGALGSSELLFLMQRRNALPILYWNRASRAHFARPADRTAVGTVRRLLDEGSVRWFVPPRRIAQRDQLLRGTQAVVLRSANERYAVELRRR